MKTPVPFLLKHTLREYQHIGLDWLVSLYEKRINGILADEMVSAEGGGGGETVAANITEGTIFLSQDSNKTRRQPAQSDREGAVAGGFCGQGERGVSVNAGLAGQPIREEDQRHLGRRNGEHGVDKAGS